MNWWFLLLDLVPLLVFVLVDSFSNMRYAIVCALAAAAFEIGYSFFALGGIDEFSLVSVGLILVFGGLSLRFDTPIYFKFKPVVMAAVMAGVFMVTYALDRPLLVMAVERYSHTFPQTFRNVLERPEVLGVLRRASLYMVFGLIAHGVIVGWAAVRLNNWWWLALRSVGFYVMMWLVVMSAL